MERARKRHFLKFFPIAVTIYLGLNISHSEAYVLLLTSMKERKSKRWLTGTLNCIRAPLHVPLTTSLISSTVEFDLKLVLMELTILKQALHFGSELLGPGRNSEKCVIFLLNFKMNDIRYDLSYVFSLKFDHKSHLSTPGLLAITHLLNWVKI